MTNILYLFSKLSKKFKNLIGYREFSTEYKHYKFICKYVDFKLVKEINNEYFGFIFQKDKELEKKESSIDSLIPDASDYEKIFFFYKLKSNKNSSLEYFSIEEGELISIFTINLKNDKKYQYIRRYHQDYNISIGNFYEIAEIPKLNFKRKLFYKDLYFYDCLSSYTIKHIDKVYYKDL